MDYDFEPAGYDAEKIEAGVRLILAGIGGGRDPWWP
jgi:hypothetical protein